jgi:hypothetical protein
MPLQSRVKKIPNVTFPEVRNILNILKLFIHLPRKVKCMTKEAMITTSVAAGAVAVAPAGSAR